MKTTTRWLVWCCAVLLTALAVSPAAAQQPASPAEELGLATVVGYDGRAGSSSWAPVEVVLEPVRVLEAELAVASQSSGGSVREVRTVEVAARTRQVHRFLVPTGPISITITESGREPLEVRARPETRDRGYLVAALGEVPDTPPTLQHEATGLSGTWVDLDPAWLDHSAPALEPVAALVAPAGDLADLTADHLAAVRVAVAAGTDLVVIADRPGPLPDLGLPLPAESAQPGDGGRLELGAASDAWTVTAADLAGQAAGEGEEEPAPGGVVAARHMVGRGQVSVVAAAAGDPGLGHSEALWSLIVGPPEFTGNQNNEWAVDQIAYQFARIFSSGDGFSPALPWLALFTIAYVLVVGPVNGFLLARMGRRELAWATVPIVTVVFTVGAFLGVTGSRPPMGLAGRALVSVDGIGTELVALGVRAPTAGERTIEMPGEGWSVRVLSEAAGGAEIQRGDDIRATVQLSALQLGGLVATRATDATTPLVVEATAGSSGVTAVVRNTGGQPIDGVVVRAATSSRSVGTLAPGEEQEVELGSELLSAVQPYRDPFEGLSSGAPRTLEALLRDRLIDGAPGLVWAVGTVDAAGVEARVDGVRPDDRGTLVATAVRPTQGDALSAFAVSRESVTTRQQAYRPSPLAIENVEEAFVHFQLPAGASAEQLRQRLRAEQGNRQDFSVWLPSERAWRPVGEVFADDVAPTSVVADPLGTVWIRVQGDLYPFNSSALSLSDGQDT